MPVGACGPVEHPAVGLKRRMISLTFIGTRCPVQVSVSADVYFLSPVLRWSRTLHALRLAERTVLRPRPREQTETEPATAKQEPDRETGNETGKETEHAALRQQSRTRWLVRLSRSIRSVNIDYLSRSRFRSTAPRSRDRRAPLPSEPLASADIYPCQVLVESDLLG